MNEKSDTKKLTGVPETLLVALYLRAVETQREDGIIKDEKAVEMIQSIEYDFARFNKAWASQVGVAVRTEILDKASTAFMRLFAYIPPLKRHIMNKIVHLRFRECGDVVEK